jgi:hypothetical protein
VPAETGENDVAELSERDKKAIFGANYEAPVVTQANLDEQRTAKRVNLRNTVIGIAVVVAVMVVASFFRT